MRCCAEDEGLALRSRPAGGGFKPPHAAAVTAVRGERCGNGADRGVRWGSGRRSLVTCRYLTQGGIKTGEILCDPGGAWRVPASWPGGVRHGGDVSLICCFRMERGKARPDTATPQGVATGSVPSGSNRKGLSTVAGRAGGPARSSEEASVMGVEPRGWVIRGWFGWSTGGPPGGAEWTS